MLYYPCIFDNRSGYIILQVNRFPRTREQCERFLRRHYLSLWRQCAAIPQPVTHTGLIPAWKKGA